MSSLDITEKKRKDMAFLHITEKLSNAIVPIGFGALIVMMVGIVINVAGRVFFSTPLYGAVEIVEITGAILISCIAAYTQARRFNVAVGIVVDKLSPGVQKVVDIFTMLLTLVAAAALLWAAFDVALEMTIIKEETGIFQIAKYPFRIVWVFGLIFLFVVLLAQFVNSVARLVKR